MSFRDLVKRIWIRRENRRYEKLLAKRRLTYGQWLARMETAESSVSAGLSASGEPSARRECQRAVSGPAFRCFLSSRGAAAEHLSAEIENAFRTHPEWMLLYGDEDVLEAGELQNPWFKPDWSPDLLDSCFYFGSVVAVREELMQRAAEACGAQGPNAQQPNAQQRGSFCGAGTAEDAGNCSFVTDFPAFEKWVHTCVALAGGYARESDSIGHLDRILFHCADGEQMSKYLQTSDWLRQGQQALLRDFTDSRTGSSPEAGEAYVPEAGGMYVPGADKAHAPAVSVVIPSRDHPDILEQCLRGCLKALEGLPAQILIVDNGSSPDNRRRIQEMAERPETLCAAGTEPGPVSVFYLYEPMEFHFSRMCNLGAERAAGDFLLFLNDDVELCMPGCIARMASLAGRPYTGAVGMKLYYPESDRIQHAGITNLPMGPVHKLQFHSDREPCYFGCNRGMRNVLAVTGACLMVEKEKFREAGGFAEELPVAFNDVDLGFTLYEKGYFNVCMNDLHAYHHESLSRGGDESAGKLKRLLSELDKLYERHPGLEGKDPYYSRHLNREGLDTRIRPACETAGNRLQRPAGLVYRESMGGYRSDPCVLLRVESIRDGILQGYGVVLGDNNACYDKEILLIPDSGRRDSGQQDSGRRDSEQQSPERQGSGGQSSDEHSGDCGGDGTEAAYCIRVEGQYRPDLTENLPDQVNVGLSGFWIALQPGVLPDGSYRIGMAVRNRVTGLRLMNKSNRYFNAPEDFR